MKIRPLLLCIILVLAISGCWSPSACIRWESQSVCLPGGKIQVLTIDIFRGSATIVNMDDSKGVECINLREIPDGYEESKGGALFGADHSWLPNKDYQIGIGIKGDQQPPFIQFSTDSLGTVIDPGACACRER
jgi:hypothetical protein